MPCELIGRTMNLNVIADLNIDLTAVSDILGLPLFLGSALVIILVLRKSKTPAASKPTWEFRLMRRTRTAGGISGATTELFEVSRARRASSQSLKLECGEGCESSHAA